MAVILTWPYDVFILTEVRTPVASQNSLARLASTHRCSCLWSQVPPPSPTFAVSPGGTMILAREPWQVRHFAFPALKRWESLSRMVSGNIIGPNQETLTVIAMYGFAESHMLRKNNEDMIKEALASLSCLTNPSLLAGDLNVTRAASPILSSAPNSGMHFLSPLTFQPQCLEMEAGQSRLLLIM